MVCLLRLPVPRPPAPTSGVWALPWPEISTGSGRRQRRRKASGIGAAPVLASAGAGSSIGAMSVPPSWAGRSRNPGGKHARHAGVAELGRRSRRDVGRISGHHGRDACGRQRRSRRLELRSPALRRQAQGHAGDSQADAQLDSSLGQCRPTKHQSYSHHQIDRNSRHGF